MHKHTPGSWVAYNRIGNRILGSWRVASESIGQPCGICKMDESLTGDQEVANAKLIAAAPDLLAALEHAAERAAERGDKEAMNIYNAAINKATR